MTKRIVVSTLALGALFVSFGCRREVAFDRPMTMGETLSITEVRKSLGTEAPSATGGGPTAPAAPLESVDQTIESIDAGK